MPAYAKITSALAIGLALTGGGAALAQSTTATEGHTALVEMVHIVPGPDDEERVLTGSVPCQRPGLLERAWDAWWGRSSCDRGGYAYAYPNGYQPPWEGEIQSVNDATHVDEDGHRWHVAEIVYRTQTDSPKSGQLVRAVASEVLPSERAGDGRQVDYAIPLTGELLEREQTLIVGFGPGPTPTG